VIGCSTLKRIDDYGTCRIKPGHNGQNTASEMETRCMSEHGGICISLICLAVGIQGQVNCLVSDLQAPNLTSCLQN